MLTVKNITITGLKEAVETARTYYGTVNRSDSSKENFLIGRSDLNLIKSSLVRGTSYNKFLDLIKVTMQIKAPMYWWNSMSEVMRPLSIAYSPDLTQVLLKNRLQKPFTEEDFAVENLDTELIEVFTLELDYLNAIREDFLYFGEDCPRHKVLDLLAVMPMSWYVTDTLQLSYNDVFEILLNPNLPDLLPEWNELTDVLKKQPYIKTFMELLVNT